MEEEGALTLSANDTRSCNFYINPVNTVLILEMEKKMKLRLSKLK